MRRALAAMTHILNIAERVVDRNDGGAVLHAGGLAHEAADAAKTGDAHIDHG